MKKVDAYVSDHRRKRKKQRAYFWGSVITLTIGVVVTGIAWFMLRSPFFELDHIVVQGNTIVANDTVVTLLQSSVLRDHGFMKSILGIRNLLIWPDHLTEHDLMLVPQLADISLSRDYFSNTLNAQVTERDPFAIWCFVANGQNDKRCYWFDRTGVLFEHAFAAEGNIVFTVNDYDQHPKGLDEEVLPHAFVPNLISILSTMRATGLSIESVTLKDLSLEEVSVTPHNGPTLFFSLRFPADNYLPVIQNLMKQAGFSKLQYIDCRTENRVYYK